MLIVVRHGRTEANAAGLLLGRLDPPLDAVGAAQAARLAAAVGPVDRVVSSPLRRAVETAAAFGAPVTVDPAWIELDYGALDGTPAAAVPAATWQRWRADPDFVPAGGESLRRLHDRVEAACEALLADAADQDVVVVTHVSPVKAAVAWALGADVGVVWRCRVDPASISRIELTRRGPVLRSFNELAHLG